MSAVILKFPCGRRDRATPIHRDLGFVEPTLEGKVRQIGIRFGLNHIQRETLVSLAKQHHGWGLPEYQVLARAEERARRMASGDADGPGAA